MRLLPVILFILVSFFRHDGGGEECCGLAERYGSIASDCTQKGLGDDAGSSALCLTGSSAINVRTEIPQPKCQRLASGEIPSVKLVNIQRNSVQLSPNHVRPKGLMSGGGLIYAIGCLRI